MELITTKTLTTPIGVFRMEWSRNGDAYEWSLLNCVGQYEAGGGGLTAGGFALAARKARSAATIIADEVLERAQREAEESA